MSTSLLTGDQNEINAIFLWEGCKVFAFKSSCDIPKFRNDMS